MAFAFVIYRVSIRKTNDHYDEDSLLRKEVKYAAGAGALFVFAQILGII